MAQLSDTTNQSGLVQQVEKWTRREYGSSGNDLREIINSLNIAFDRIMPLLLAYSDQLRWDDLNHTDAPIGTTNLVANQNDYKITVDDNSLDILNLVAVRIYPSSSATVYSELKRITLDDARVPEIMSPNSAVTGVPSGFLEVGNILYLDVLPSYSATSGIQLFFQRQQSYFTVTGTSGDDTKEPGIPLPFHELIALYAALDWNSINRTEDTNLLSLIQARINRREKELTEFIHLRHPSKAVMRPRRIDVLGNRNEGAPTRWYI